MAENNLANKFNEKKLKNIKISKELEKIKELQRMEWNNIINEVSDALGIDSARCCFDEDENRLIFFVHILDKEDLKKIIDFDADLYIECTDYDYMKLIIDLD